MTDKVLTTATDVVCAANSSEAGAAPAAKPAQVAKRRPVIERQEMPAQEPSLRVQNFEEVNLGYALKSAELEASRCLRCKTAPCIGACPVAVNIPGFIRAVADGRLAEAAQILRNTNTLPCITGRVCPQETQCESTCVLSKKGKSVAIGHLERFVADWAMREGNTSAETQADVNKRIAVVGSGPGGLACAGELRRMGYEVTLFEALHTLGGVLRYGIPEFRLPRAIVDYEIEKLIELGVQVVSNVIIGATISLDELLGSLGYQAVYLACGAGYPVFLNIPGENLKGVYSANEFLTRINLMGAAPGSDSATPLLTASDVVVIGGGNTALDAVRTARRMKARHAILAYRRSREEMPARAEEVRHAEEEGVRFEFLVNPVAILGDEHGWVRSVKCSRMELSEPDSSGRRRPIAIADSEFEIPCRVVIEAIGTRANPLLTRDTPQLKLGPRGYIEVDSRGMTSMPGVFAGGDIVRGGASVILAMGDGKSAASSIHRFLTEN